MTILGIWQPASAPDALINDPFAEPLVRAVGVDFFTRLASGELDPDAVDGGAGMERMTGMMAVRTRLIDDYFADAGAAGVPSQRRSGPVA